MRIETLTNKSQDSLADAQSLTLGNDNQFIEPTHLLLAMLDPAIGLRDAIRRII
jgi:ATP-dependent Clp protease ATP-binding subunit ClpB